MPDDQLRLADLLAGLSVATDLGMGHEPEKAVRSCLVATRLARELDLPESQVRDVYYTALLQHVGCTAPAHETTRLFGDDLTGTPRAERTDPRRAREALALLATAGRGRGLQRGRYLVRAATAGEKGTVAILQAVCEVAAHVAGRLRMGAGVRDGLFHSLEGWDGKAGPLGLAGDDIALPARITTVATQAVIFDRLGGPDAALDMVRRRAGGWFDPAVATAFARVGAGVLAGLAEADVWEEVLAAEPAPARRIPHAGLDDVAGAFADMVDLKTPFTLGHSAGVAELAAAAARGIGLPARDVTLLRRAGLLHDLGRVAVPNLVWEAPRTLTTTQREQVRLHPYHSERILTRSAGLRPAARLAGAHHERQDGSGYPHGTSGAALAPEARLLAVADAYQAMTQDRPYRPARRPAEAAAEIEALVASGAFDPECARAVLAAAGQPPERVRDAWPGGLSDREVDVLRLVARGLSNRDVAEALFISRRTAEHHVQHIYTKIGVSTRAAAAMFAMRHGLVR